MAFANWTVLFVLCALGIFLGGALVGYAFAMQGYVDEPDPTQEAGA